MEITEQQRKELLAYLAKRPYAEVFQLVAMLVGLRPEPVKTNGKEKDKVTPKN